MMRVLTHLKWKGTKCYTVMLDTNDPLTCHSTRMHSQWLHQVKSHYYTVQIIISFM